MQKILSANNNYNELDQYLLASGHKKILLVCGSSLRFLKLNAYFETLDERLGIQVVRFSEFKPNPLYESVVAGVRLLNEEEIKLVIAVGGGSAIDVAKCIKLYANMDHTQNYLKQKIEPNDIAFAAIPTTAGTGSESTRFAVIYYEGVKQSINHISGIPEMILFDPSALESLPLYQKKCTMMDALCHAMESFWSVNSTEESKAYSRKAIQLVLEHKEGYLKNDPVANEHMLFAANYAGRAIDLAQTTAGHAMCYSLVALYGISHGHGVALCVSKLFPYMLEHMEDCADSRGITYLEDMFQKLAEVMDCACPKEAAELFQRIFDELEFSVPDACDEDFAVMNTSVNPIRLKNNPVLLDDNAIDMLYHEIVHVI